MADTLAEYQKNAIDRARAVSNLSGIDATTAWLNQRYDKPTDYSGTVGVATAYAEAFGIAQHLLFVLLQIIERDHPELTRADVTAALLTVEA